MLTIADLHGLLKIAVLKKFQDTAPPSSLLRSYFIDEVTDAYAIRFGIRRATNLMAPQVTLGTEAKMINFGKESEKLFVPPNYFLGFKGNELDRFDDRIFAQTQNQNAATYGELIDEVAEKFVHLRQRIERAKEFQAMEALFNGIITMKDGTNIDYKRKVDSIKDFSGTPWATSTTDIRAHLDYGANFIRTEGLHAGNEFDLILEGQGWRNLQDSNFFDKLGNFRRVNLLDIQTPRQNAVGGVYHGQISGSNCVFNIYTYPAIYTNSLGATTKYWDEDYALIVPTTGTDFVMAHAGIPRIFGKGANRRVLNAKGTYYLNNYISERLRAHNFTMESRPLAITRSVDTVVTLKIN